MSYSFYIFTLLFPALIIAAAVPTSIEVSSVRLDKVYPRDINSHYLSDIPNPPLSCKLSLWTSLDDISPYSEDIGPSFKMEGSDCDFNSIALRISCPENGPISSQFDLTGRETFLKKLSWSNYYTINPIVHVCKLDNRSAYQVNIVTSFAAASTQDIDLSASSSRYARTLNVDLRIAVKPSVMI